MAAEIIREQVLLETDEEIPYATTVIVDDFEEGAKLTRIAATIYCERAGQKGILIGKRGQMLKKIGTAARLQIQRMLWTKVFLELYVKVQAGWRDSREVPASSPSSHSMGCRSTIPPATRSLALQT